VNFVGERVTVSVVDEGVGNGPVNVVLRDLTVVQESSLSIHDERLLVGGRRFLLVPTYRWCSRLDLGAADDRSVRGLVAVSREDMAARAPAGSLAWLLHEDAPVRCGFEIPCNQEIERGVQLLFGGREAEGVRRLCGTGIGLTPGGDDFLVGHLAARHVLAWLGIDRFVMPFAEFRRHTPQTTLLSGTALTMAAEGSFAAPVKALVEGLSRGDGAAVSAHGDRLLRMGATSGADLLTGMFCTLERALS
jgi:hypothetical protein